MTGRSEAGMVTAEFAVTIPAIIIVLALAIGGLHHVSAQGDACHAARVFARQITVGVDSATAARQARNSITRPVNVVNTRDGEYLVITAQVSSQFLDFRFAQCTIRTIAQER